MEILKTILPEDIVSRIGDEDTDNEKLQADLKKWLSDREQMAVDNGIKDFKKKYEEEFGEEVYKKATRKLADNLAKMGNFTSKEVKEKKVDELLEAYNQKVQEKIKLASEGKNEEYVKKIDDLTEQYQNAIKDNETLQSQLEEKSKQVEREIRSFHVKRLKNDIYSQLNFDDEKKKRIYIQALDQFTDQFVVDPETGTIKNKDQTSVQKPDKSGIWENIEEPIKWFAKENGMLLESHGGKTKRKFKKAGDGDDGDIDYAGADFLAEKMGTTFSPDPD